MTINQLLGLTTSRPLRRLRNWWLTRVEDHYLISAAHEARVAKQAHANAAFYQKQAALVRSRRNTS